MEDERSGAGDECGYRGGAGAWSMMDSSAGVHTSMSRAGISLSGSSVYSKTVDTVMGGATSLVLPRSSSACNASVAGSSPAFVKGISFGSGTGFDAVRLSDGGATRSLGAEDMAEDWAILDLG